MAAAHQFRDKPRVLVITLRRLGDVLLTTPLVHALKQGIPGARIDMLVFRGTEGMLAGNPDIDRVIAIPPKPSIAETVKLIAQLWRRYDLAVSTQSGDRPTLFTAIAGRFRVGLVPWRNPKWKPWVFNRAVANDPKVHRIVELQRLASALGIALPPPPIILPAKVKLAARAPYAVLHAHPAFRIRRWTDDGWRGLAKGLSERGLAVVATGGPSPDERDYLDRIWNPVVPKVERVDGRLNWGELAELMAGAQVFVGLDTSMSHLAAGTGCPTIAIYGPASPHLMGPWPIGGLSEPWAKAGSIQNRGNVWVVQNPLPCMPCDLLGCERHDDSYSTCLDELSVEPVLRAVDMALGRMPTKPVPVIPRVSA